VKTMADLHPLTLDEVDSLLHSVRNPRSEEVSDDQPETEVVPEVA